MPLGGLLTIGLITAGTQIYAAHKQASSAQKAADQQTAATDKAIALRQPYVDTGTKAFTTLGSLMGLGGGQGGGQAPAVQSSLPSTVGQVTGPSTNYPSKMGAISDPSVLGGNAAQAPGGGGALMGTPGQVAASQAASSYPSYTPHTSPVPMVTMREPGPNGTTQQIPADQVSYWTQKGATVVHG